MPHVGIPLRRAGSTSADCFVFLTRGRVRARVWGGTDTKEWTQLHTTGPCPAPRFCHSAVVCIALPQRGRKAAIQSSLIRRRLDLANTCGARTLDWVPSCIAERELPTNTV